MAVWTEKFCLSSLWERNKEVARLKLLCVAARRNGADVGSLLPACVARGGFCDVRNDVGIRNKVKRKNYFEVEMFRYSAF